MTTNKSLKRSVLFSIILLISATMSYAQITKIEIQATGLTCSMCSNAIYKQLKTIAAVDKIETDLNTNTFFITLKKGNQLKPNVFKDKVEKAGFFVGAFFVTAIPDILKNTHYILTEGKPNKQNEIKFQVLDKGYVTDKAFKKLAKTYKELNVDNENDFHIKILN